MKFQFEVEAADIREAARMLMNSVAPLLDTPTNANPEPVQTAKAVKKQKAEPAVTAAATPADPPHVEQAPEFNFLDDQPEQPKEEPKITKDLLSAKLSSIATSGYQAALGPILNNRKLNAIPETEYPTVLENARKAVEQIIAKVGGFDKLPATIQKEFPELGQ